MKYFQKLQHNHNRIVAPLVGAWIEISFLCAKINESFVAPLVGAWIEIVKYANMREIN